MVRNGWLYHVAFRVPAAWGEWRRAMTVAVLMLGTIYTVKVFDLVFIMTGGGPANTSHLLSTYAYQVGFSILNYGQAAAIATVIVVLILSLNLFQLFLQRK